MKIHEYQAKELFRNYDLPVPAGGIAFSVDEVVKTAEKLNRFPVVVKAQIHAGGRGKGGGVKLCSSMAEVKTAADGIIGMNLITHQTGPEGKTVKKVLVEAGLNIRHEFYLSLVPDRASADTIIMASREGGMEIEEVAEKSPEKIIRVNVDSATGLQAYHCRKAGFGLELSGAALKSFTSMLQKLYRLFVETDASMVEINPLVLTDDDQFIALDAKVDFDDNALYRHPDIKEMRDPDEEDPLELEASKFNLNYISLDGNIGNIVNGAGLAMATMDLIKNAGAEPANFLDVGGGATSEMVENALRILLMDEKVKGILINIFGGILRCDVFAEGVVRAAEKTGIDIPVVVRMEGTNVEKGRQILADSGLKLETAVDLKDAAEKIAAIVK